MNPEFVYKQKRYKVTLMGNKAGREIAKLEQLFQQAKYPVSLHRDWRYLVGKPVVIAEWHNLSEKIALMAVKALRHCGASPDISEYEKLTVFDDVNLSKDFPRRFAATIHHLKMQENPNSLAAWQEDMLEFINNWYSNSLLNLDEPALELWATAENIDESYRLSILPSFHAPRVIRVYKNRDSFHLINKVGRMPFSKTSGIDINSQTRLEPQLFEELSRFMKQHFWEIDTWYSWYGASVLDGTILLFEGWKDGKYQFLDDHSPKAESTAAQAYELFEKIKTSI